MSLSGCGTGDEFGSGSSIRSSTANSYVCANCTDPLDLNLFSAFDTFAHPSREGFLTWTYTTSTELKSDLLEDCIKTKIIPISKALGTVFLYEDEREAQVDFCSKDETDKTQQLPGLTAETPDESQKELTKVKPEEDKRRWKLCRKCATILLELYKMYEEFIQLCKDGSLVYQKYLLERQNIKRRNESQVITRQGSTKSERDVNLETGSTGSFSQNYRNSKTMSKTSKKSRKSLDKHISETEKEEELENSLLSSAVKVEMDYDYDSAGNGSDGIWDPDFEFYGENSDESTEVMAPFMIIPESSSKPKVTPPPETRKKRGRPRKDRSETVVPKPKTRGKSKQKEVTENPETEDEDGFSEDDFKNELDPDYREDIDEVENSLSRDDNVSGSSDSRDSDEEEPWEPKKLPEKKKGRPTGRKRGRPKKTLDPVSGPATKRKRGRPAKLPFEKANNGDKAYSCEYCGKEAKSRWNLNMHIKCVHEKIRPYSCKSCPKTFFAKHALNVHTHRFHQGDKPEDSPHKCPEPGCGKTYAYPASLYQHKLSHQPREKYKYACTLCGWKFKHAYRLQEHMLVHTNERPSICDQCGGAFKSNRALNKHMLSQHPRPEDNRKLPSCDICGKVLRNAWNLRLHVRSVHEGLKPHQCHLCGKAFSCSSNLKIHVTGVPGSSDGGCQTRMNKGRISKTKKGVSSSCSSIAEQSGKNNLDNSNNSSSMNMNPINFSSVDHHAIPSTSSSIGHLSYSDGARPSGTLTELMTSAAVNS